MQSLLDERNWLAWLVKVRIIILTLLLGIELSIARLTPNPCQLGFLSASFCFGMRFPASIFFCCRSGKSIAFNRCFRFSPTWCWSQAVVYATGGVDSSLNFLYPLVIIVASVLLSRTWTYISAALASILYGAVIELTYYESLKSYSTSHPAPSTLQAIILMNLCAFMAVAYLAGLLAAKLRSQCKTQAYQRSAGRPASPT
jgi:two-component system sensor histidine kinase PilS (NtrC family)